MININIYFKPDGCPYSGMGLVELDPIKPDLVYAYLLFGHWFGRARHSQTRPDCRLE
jgi:hypothetical protein